MIYDANGKPVSSRKTDYTLWLCLVFALFCSCWTWAAHGQNVQLSPGPVLLTSPATISPDSERAVYADAAGLWSVPLHGGAPVPLMTLLPGRQVYGAARITPDGARVVYVADQDTQGKPELYSVPISGGPSVRISKDLVLGGHVLNFDLSLSLDQVYYEADAVTNNTVELWRVPVTGGLSVRVNRTLPATNYDVFEYANGGSPEYVVYRVGRTVQGRYELWSVSATGTSSSARRISPSSMVTGGAVNDHFSISPDGSVVYLADTIDDNRFDLWSVPIAGGTSTRLDRDDGRSVREDFLVDASDVRYSYAPSEWWSVSITGGVSVQIPPPMPEPVRSPDGEWIVYGAGVGLWSSGPSGNHRLVSCAGQSVTTSFLAKPAYSISSDSRTVVYIANSALWSSPISGAVCLLFRDGFESGSTSAWR